MREKETFRQAQLTLVSLPTIGHVVRFPSFSPSPSIMIHSDHGLLHFLVLAHTPANATIFMTSVSVCAQQGQ